MNNYHPITPAQIETLIQQGCWAEEWKDIEVTPDFNPSTLHHVTFYGHIRLSGTSNTNRHKLQTGIRHTTLHNVWIHQDVTIENVRFIEGYQIHSGTNICNISELRADTPHESLFTEGITVGNEAGAPNISFTPLPNEQIDWLRAHHLLPMPPHPTFPSKHTGYTFASIGENCTIRHGGIIRNVSIGNNSTLEGFSHLEKGAIGERCHIGTQTIAQVFHIGDDSHVTDNAKLYHVIATNHCKIGKGFTAENCYICHHSELFCGEACAIFAGSHTVSHHKSTLLIGGEFSFYNAGSGTNQSNHAYKLGPIHHGTLARGSKTASGCHILWPMSTAPFTLIMGKIKTHPTLSKLPFSYVISDGTTVFVAPGINLCTAGTFRDIQKWKERGQSSCQGTYDFLSPFVMQYVFQGIQTLERLQHDYGTELDSYPYNGTIIRRSSLERGLARYQLAVKLFAASILPNADNILPESENWVWLDIAGFITPHDPSQPIEQIEQEVLASFNQDYYTRKQQWGATLLHRYFGNDFLSGVLYKQREEAINEWKQLIIADARKEFALGDVEACLVEQFIKKVEQEAESIFSK